MNYFVAKNRSGAGFVGSYSLEEINQQFQAGKIPGNYVVTKSTGPSFNELMKFGSPVWITVSELIADPQNDIFTAETHGVAYQRSETGGGAILALRICAWLDLAFGIVGALYIWVNTPTSRYSPTEATYFTIGLGCAVWFQGVLVCSFFLVVALIAENVIAIRQKSSN